jgi:hypothetical protein
VPALRSSVALARPKVAFYGSRRVELRPARDLRLALRRGERLRRSITAPGELHGPLERGARVGKVTVLVDGRRVQTVALVTAESVPKAGFLRKLLHYALPPLLVVVLAVAVLFVVDGRRRRLRAAEAARRRRAARAE